LRMSGRGVLLSALNFSPRRVLAPRLFEDFQEKRESRV
jgi:hypothetical protein